MPTEVRGGLWVLGGLGEKDEVYSDAWKSEDLRVWRRERWPTWSKRYAFACVVHGDDILVLGGRDAGGDYLREALLRTRLNKIE